MIPGVPIGAGEWRGARSGNTRSRKVWTSGRVWKRQPPDRPTSSTARPCHSSFSSARSLRTVSALTSPSNSRFSSVMPSGSGVASSAASRIRLASNGLCIAQFYVNRREALGLRDLHQQLARELQQREEGHHQHRHAALRLEQLAELEHPPLAQR